MVAVPDPRSPLLWSAPGETSPGEAHPARVSDAALRRHVQDRGLPEARATLDGDPRARGARPHHGRILTSTTTPPTPKLSRLSTAMGQLPLDGAPSTCSPGWPASFRERALSRTAVELATPFAVLRRHRGGPHPPVSRFDMILTPALAMPPRPVGWFHEGFDIADPAGADQDYRRRCQYTPWTWW
ncbi:hypothetical protein QJS66_10335 [Kocuria rhizophila]|nr:hypothetical protein QJS66_10335 [Kocuria rhizophila]